MTSPARRRFREILAGQQCLLTASVHDPITARSAQDLGYEIGMLAGSTAAIAVLGAPDITLLTLSEFAEQATRICRAAPDLPILADADHGYGNALNVMRTVEELERAGIAALTIEDTALPQPFGSGSRPRMLSLEEGVGKLRAALRARRDPGTVVVGRTSAARLDGVEEAVRRFQAYERAGADAIFVAGLKDEADLEPICAAVNVPVIVSTVKTSVERLAELGVRVQLQPHLPIRAAAHAAHETLKALRQGVPAGEIGDVASESFMETATRASNYAGWIREFLN